VSSKVIRLHPKDNVAIALGGLHKSQLIAFEGEMLEVLSDVCDMHKIAVEDIASGQQITKYGQLIGHASADIKRGEYVHAHNCAMSEIDRTYDDFCKNAVATEYVPEEKRASFQGYRRSNGKVGTRNYLGILTTVNCSATVARQIAHQIEISGILQQYPNVDGVVAITHESGCGMRSEGEGYDVLRRTFEGYARHPNFGGLLMVGLGCETMQVQQVLAQSGLKESSSFRAFTIQDKGGTRRTVEAGVSELKQMLPEVNAHQRSRCSASELVLALQCGGSDALSGVTANPALGCAADLLVQHGGSVIYSETPEIYGAEHLLAQRAESPEVAEKLIERIRWWEQYTRQHGFELNNNPSPGNKAGGLTTILEKSLGAQAKSGSTTMTDVIEYAEQIKTKGLVFMDSPGFDPVSVTGQVASGANVVCFTTGRGSAFGFKPVPSIKLSSNTAIFKHMEEDIDINCGSVIDGEETLAESGQKIFELVLAIASGDLSKSEALGYGDAEFNPWKIGAVV
jgi:altronate hydrolase